MKKFYVSYQIKDTIHKLLHPFKYGFWCIMAIGKSFYNKHFFFGMLWETWDSYAGDGDYGFDYFWTGNRKTWKQLKYYKKFGIDDDGSFQFIIPFFIAWLLVLPGSIYIDYKSKKETDEFVKYCQQEDLINQEK